ncbi:HNH endonuclease [Rhizobiales bacterium RZME27]|uniref:HNH endonuclease n=1 Tax=Endobacterium cereale TaxID=2663029 RepID=A0A6A8AEM7_9HYPH|nr:HNH endonuclease [Endobacterium cereale]MQY48237.1 HNH endonuclease [Endobacterium cereale]
MTDVGTTKRRSMSPTRRLRIWEAHGGVCCLCQTKIDGVREAWTVEHLRALGLGGEDEDANCAPAHETCRRKKDKVDVSAIAKAKRVKAKHIGVAKAKSSLSHPQFKRLMDGTVVRRDTGEIVGGNRT